MILPQPSMSPELTAIKNAIIIVKKKIQTAIKINNNIFAIVFAKFDIFNLINYSIDSVLLYITWMFNPQTSRLAKSLKKKFFDYKKA